MNKRMEKIVKIAVASQMILASGTLFAAEEIAKLDPNHKAAEGLEGQQVVFYDALKAPFELTGFPWRKSADAPLYRLPAALTENDINQRVLNLAHDTSGGAIRFATDSSLIIVRAMIAHGTDHAHMPRTATTGLDLVIDSTMAAYATDALDVTDDILKAMNVDPAKRKALKEKSKEKKSEGK